MTKAITRPSATKPVFRVRVCSTEALWILVEADNEDDAVQRAEHIDGGYFHADWSHTSWDIEGAELVTDFDPDQLAPPEAYDSL